MRFAPWCETLQQKPVPRPLHSSSLSDSFRTTFMSSFVSTGSALMTSPSMSTANFPFLSLSLYRLVFVRQFLYRLHRLSLILALAFPSNDMVLDLTRWRLFVLALAFAVGGVDCTFGGRLFASSGGW